ncbi:hypothetical protein RF11_05205 [Thelohanellus kitauei]|uniref:Uncharacterized protein n=1 Tax=Thelohanellus kitauei TaxID=669202 RepID=A0A0C2M6B9_THEKT|nr:hypothetical protein RF11_05205 [Thelohanellus kitauei]
MEVPEVLTFNKSPRPKSLYKMQNFLAELIVALSDQTYINKVQNEKKLLMYEDLKNCDLAVINYDLIREVFIGCESNLRGAFDNELYDCRTVSEYKMYKHVMAKIVLIFNESKFLDQKTADYYTKLFFPKDSSSIIKYIYDRDENSYFSLASDVASNKSSLYNLQLLFVFKLFKLVYEMKFIFCDIDSRFPNIV